VVLEKIQSLRRLGSHHQFKKQALSSLPLKPDESPTEKV
jgi:predicted RNA binding protein YcfA (HicA-like mRNA interferase family)